MSVGERARRRRRTRPVAVSKEHYRRRRLAAVLIGLLVIVVFGFGARVLLYDMDLFDVEDVRVEGTVTVDAKDVVAAAAVPRGAPLADVDGVAVADRVRRIPAVESVEVSRSWPHTLTVTVTERVPIATLDAQQGQVLVDRHGVVYQGRSGVRLPRLTTPPTSADPATAAAAAVLAALPPDLREQVETAGAVVDVPGSPAHVELDLADGRTVRWGSAERAPEKAAALTALLTQPGTVFDVSSPDLPTVRR